MKKGIILSILLGVLVLLLPSHRGMVKTPMELYRPYLLAEIENSIRSLEELKAGVGNKTEIEKKYHESRKHYKHIEAFVEYFSSQQAKFNINGPLVPKSDPEYGGKIFYPCGYQAIEEIIFDHEKVDENKLLVFVAQLMIDLNKLKIEYANIQVKDEELLEMLQYELYRITALNLNGYDATFTLTGIQEARWSFEGMQQIFQSFVSFRKKGKECKTLYDLYLNQTKNIFDHFETLDSFYELNRLLFATEYVNNLNSTLVRFHHATQIPWTNNRSSLNLNNEFLFGKESFNMRAFSINYDDTVNLKQKAELGKKLFFDQNLSGDLQRSCATCHQPQLAFTDGLPKSMAFTKGDFVQRNAPTLLNVAFQRRFFYDGRVDQLEEQIVNVIHNPTEMNGDLVDIVKRVRMNKEYDDYFFKAFGDNEVSPLRVIISIAEYEKTLVSLNSRFDQFLRGDHDALNSREINGYNLFSGKALCATCHFFPLFNGTVPPNFTDSEFEILGTPANADNSSLDDDVGRYIVTNSDIHQYAFKTPTLRNIELTAPYMHNGVYSTLDQVMDFYHKGGGQGFGYEVPNQTLPFDSLELTTREKEDIILFMRSLTDTSSYR